MTRIAIVVGSTRPNRNARDVAEWVHQNAPQGGDAEYELVDIADFNLPLLDEPMPPAMGQYENEHTKVWAEKVASFDGYIFVTPEYNHSVPAALKNAVDYLYAEWNNKAIGFVSYGSAGGTRAVEAWRLIAAELQMADVRAQVFLSFSTDFNGMTEFAPTDGATGALQGVFEQVAAWAKALEPLRA
ncbi:NAD(P)H-dependent oxidoreductase [Corynebacterium sp. YIM 101645]|uniref:NAD(P)H-dependent oxidoreductase n=1 Tax=Corynebacterium lemuris TaxID=1859292 RepID=A0ABT2FTL9_9CORY|nr:NAD(P)H-dependent oxidoreductase [Corynebacterium lemuris]MCS5478160.1 NAD(P)H-dependent oxidoreductase [Corynebacterium lemuris]